MKNRIQAILDDPGLDRAGRIEALLGLYREARALQRAASESAMAGDDGSNANLRLLDLALHKLGADPVGSEDGGAATL